jgi:ABC-type transport system substrate-binding protein
MLVALRNAPTSQQALGSDAMNISLAPSTDISQMALYFLSSNAAPKGRNWSNWKKEQFDNLISRIEMSTDQEQILADARKAHELIVDDAPWVFIVHDRNARAMTKKVKGFISAQSWFQDFTNVDMEYPVSLARPAVRRASLYEGKSLRATIADRVRWLGLP